MSKKAKLSQLHKELCESPKKDNNTNTKGKNTSEANPKRGNRGSFSQITITICPKMLAQVQKLGIERKLEGQRDTDVSSLIRESLKIFLEKENEKNL